MAEPYQYHVEEKSLTQGFLLKFVWNPIVERIPPSVTPNTITVCGGVCMLVSSIFVWLALTKSPWGFWAAGLFVFLYMMGDNIDGPHARHTGQSSKLGEFLDHWLDSINSIVVNLCVATALGLNGWLLVAMMACVALAFFTTIWEHHHTGVFHSGRLGTNEALLLIITLYIFLFFVNPKTSWIAYQGFDKVSLASLLAYISILGCLGTIAGALWRVRQHWHEFMPILLLLAALGTLVYEGLLPFTWAAFGMLATNSLLVGPFLLHRLANRSSPYRNWLASGFALIAILSAFLVPGQVAVWSTYIFYSVGGLFALALLWDLRRGVKFLPGPAPKQ